MKLTLCHTRFFPQSYSSPPPARLTAAFHHKAFVTTGVSVALSLGLFIDPPSVASEFPLNQSPAVSLIPRNDKDQLDCRRDELELNTDAVESEPVTDDGIVAEAWQIVNDKFFSTGRGSWSPESWLTKKDDILSTPIQSRSRAHDIIRRMLTSLGDPYTRFLSPAEV